MQALALCNSLSSSLSNSLCTTLCLALLLCTPAYSQGLQPSTWTGQVTHISDGDTVWIEAHPNQQLHHPTGQARDTRQASQARKVRIEGIDAPEICQAYGQTSKAALQHKLLHKSVTVATSRIDDYGRDIAKISSQKEDIGAWLVTQGHAWSYHTRHSPGMYAKEEQTAKANQHGLFAQANPKQPRFFRQQHGPCFVKANWAE